MCSKFEDSNYPLKDVTAEVMHDRSIGHEQEPLYSPKVLTERVLFSQQSYQTAG